MLLDAALSQPVLLLQNRSITGTILQLCLLTGSLLISHGAVTAAILMLRLLLRLLLLQNRSITGTILQLCLLTGSLLISYGAVTAAILKVGLHLRLLLILGWGWALDLARRSLDLLLGLYRFSNRAVPEIGSEKDSILQRFHCQQCASHLPTLS
jgi:hypothetical protein